MYEENLTLEQIIEEETQKVEEKYRIAENLIESIPSWEVHHKIGIDYETVKLMDLRRKKRNQIKEIQREIYDLNFEIGYKMGYEEGEIIGSYKIANCMLEADVSINEIATSTDLTKEQIKKIVQTI